MEFRLIILFLAIMCAGGGCKTFPVSGNIDFSGSTLQRTLYLIEVKSFSSLASSFEGKVLDSAQFDVKGNFFFQNMPDKEGQNIYLLALQKPGEKFLTRLENENPLASNYLPFLYCPGDKVIIFSKALSMLKEVTIKSKIPENIVLQNLSRKRVEWYQQYFLENKSADEESHIENEASKLNYQKVILNFVKEEKTFMYNQWHCGGQALQVIMKGWQMRSGRFVLSLRCMTLNIHGQTRFVLNPSHFLR
ncbi:MAG: hypothetical protein IPF52_18265 [Saprospiraceae bacterium]|nr:hypothetical protein [Saprospiraceae bacterium]